MLRTNIQFAGSGSAMPKHRLHLRRPPARARPPRSRTSGWWRRRAARASVSSIRTCGVRRSTGSSGSTTPAGSAPRCVEGLPLADLAQPTRVPGLSVLHERTAAAQSRRAGGLAAHARASREAAGKDFDLVLCDSPPVISVSDGVALAAQCDGVILMIRVGTIAHEVIRRAVEQIEAVKGRILGVLLNSVDLRRDGYYYTYYRYYQSYESGEQSERRPDVPRLARRPADDPRRHVRLLGHASARRPGQRRSLPRRTRLRAFAAILSRGRASRSAPTRARTARTTTSGRRLARIWQAPGTCP